MVANGPNKEKPRVQMFALAILCEQLNVAESMQRRYYSVFVSKLQNEL